jgi:hypothetical protein
MGAGSCAVFALTILLATPLPPPGGNILSGNTINQEAVAINKDLNAVVVNAGKNGKGVAEVNAANVISQNARIGEPMAFLGGESQGVGRFGPKVVRECLGCWPGRDSQIITPPIVWGVV